MKREVFTSELIITSPDKTFEQRLMDKSWSIESYIVGNFSFFHDSLVRQGRKVFPSTLSEYYRRKIERYSDGILDMTSCLKGEFLYRLIEDEDLSMRRFLIDFGGDILGRGRHEIRIESSFTEIVTNGLFSIFTSGNGGRRGEHIKCRVQRSGTLTEIFRMEEGDLPRLADYDCYTTLRYAGDTYRREVSQEVWVENGISRILL